MLFTSKLIRLNQQRGKLWLISRLFRWHQVKGRLMEAGENDASLWLNHYKILNVLMPDQSFPQRAFHWPEAAELVTHNVISSLQQHTSRSCSFHRISAAFPSVWKSATWLVRQRPATCQHPLRLTLRRRRRRSRSQYQEQAEYRLVLKPECGGTHPWGALCGASVDDGAVSPAATSPRWQGGSCQEVSDVCRRRKPGWLHPSAAKKSR